MSALIMPWSYKNHHVLFEKQWITNDVVLQRVVRFTHRLVMYPEIETMGIKESMHPRLDREFCDLLVFFRFQHVPGQ